MEPNVFNVGPLQRFGDRMEVIADKQQQNQEMVVANRFQAYADQLRNLAFVD